MRKARNPDFFFSGRDASFCGRLGRGSLEGSAARAALADFRLLLLLFRLLLRRLRLEPRLGDGGGSLGAAGAGGTVELSSEGF